MGIDDGIADLERHVASTPSAEDHLTTSRGVDKMLWVVNMQVSTVVATPYRHRSAGRVNSGTATRGLTALSLVYLRRRNAPGTLPIDGVLAPGGATPRGPRGLILDT